MTPQELFTKSLMSYDDKDTSHDAFYNSLPYIRNYDMCNWHPHGLYSGNIVKFYQYNLDKPVILFTDTEDEEDDDFSRTAGQEDFSENDGDFSEKEDMAGSEDSFAQEGPDSGDEYSEGGEFQAFSDEDLEDV